MVPLARVGRREHIFSPDDSGLSRFAYSEREICVFRNLASSPAKRSQPVGDEVRKGDDGTRDGSQRDPPWKSPGFVMLTSFLR